MPGSTWSSASATVSDHPFRVGRTDEIADLREEERLVTEQVVACRKTADQLGLEVVAEFVGFREAARNLARSGLRAVIPRLKGAHVEVVLVTEVDKSLCDRALAGVSWLSAEG
jgi:hypothetical protein